MLNEWLTGIWNDLRQEIIDDMTASDFAFHCEAGTLKTRAELRQRIQRIWESFSDFQLAIERTAIADEKVVCRWQLAMTHTGSWHGVAPTGRRVTTLGTTSARLDGGRIKECWEFWDPQPIYFALARKVQE